MAPVTRTTGNEGEEARNLMNRLVSGAAATHMVFAAATLGIADLLQDGARSADEMAPLCGVHPHALYRLLRALTTLGVFVENRQGTFSLNTAADLLRSDVKGSMRWWAMLEGQDWYAAVWSHILYSIGTNESAFDDKHGTSFFEFCAGNPRASDIFNRVMTSFSNEEALGLVAALDFSSARRIIDIGGGHGRLLSAILATNTTLRGVLFDLPSVIAGARTDMDGAVTARCEFIAGDFFDSIPSGADCYIMKSVLHDWNDERALTILRNARNAIPDVGRLLIVERDVPEDGEPSIAKLFDISMLLWSGGMERTTRQYRALLDQSGFELQRVLHTSTPLSIYEATPRAHG